MLLGRQPYIVPLAQVDYASLVRQVSYLPFFLPNQVRHQNSEANLKIVLDNTLSACYNIHIKK